MIGLVAWFAASAASAADVSTSSVRDAISAHVSDPTAVDALVREVADAGARVERELATVGPTRGLGAQLERQITASLSDKAGRTAKAGGPLRLDAERIRATVIAYEAFKLEAYVTSGVFPKRFFGYLDGRADTGAREVRVMRTVRAAVDAANAWLAANRHPVRLTDAEVAVTFLAEGGALWIGEERAFHPVMDIGLDDLALGHRDQTALIATLDAATGSDLTGMVAWWSGSGPLPVPTAVPDHERWLRRDHGKGDASDEGPYPYLTREMSLEETVVGTTLMYVWEKELADGMLRDKHLAPMDRRTLDEQFVIASLVYNSGLLHDEARWKQILGFSAGSWLYDRSVRNKATRPELNLLPPAEQLAEFVATGVYRDQPTSWLGMYHVLQRYGAFAALMRFGAVFGPDGRFLSIPSPPDPAPDAVAPRAAPPDAPAETVRRGCGGCDTGGASLGGFGLAVALAAGLGVRGARRQRTDSARWSQARPSMTRRRASSGHALTRSVGRRGRGG